MKKVMAFFFLLMITVNAMAQGSETFTNISGSTSTYGPVSWTGDNGLPWAATDTRTDQVMNGKCATVRVGTITCNNIPGGVGTLTFNYIQFFGTAGSLQVSINSTLVGTFTPTLTQQTASIPVNVLGTFNLEIKQTVTNGRTGIDDIAWTGNGVPCTAPASQPTAIAISSIGNTTATVGFTATTADQYLAIVSTSPTLSVQPANGNTYSEDDVIGNGTVAFSGAGTGFTLHTLTPGTTYYVFIYALNNSLCSGGPVYNTSAPLKGSFATTVPPPCVAPTTTVSTVSLTASSTTATGTFTASTTADGYLVVRSTVASPGFVPVNGTTYTTGQVIGNATVVKFGTGTSFTATGLVATTQYYFFVYAMNTYNCSGGPLFNTTGTSASVTTTNTPATDWPTGYYDFAAGKSCAALKTALSKIVDNASGDFAGDNYQQNPQMYDDLWNQYKLTDIKTREVGTGSTSAVWDVYSDIPGANNDPYNYTPGTNQCGNYSAEGACYNREHSFPKSWFNDASPMISDYIHIFPTDGWVNGKRSNFRYGEVASATYSSQNGSKLGSSATAGISGTVFEPINEYKGDLARVYLYMVTCYENNLATWKTYATDGALTLDGTVFPAVNINYLKLMLKWSANDPVSPKEKDRNNGAFSFQGNRNPYVDHPEYVDMVWNNTCPGLSSLPVDVISFSGQLNGNKIYLKWEAANERDFARYEIERSFNGTAYENIGKVNATNAGNYNYTDDVSNIRGRRIYYRIKLVDKDGSFKYTAVFSIHIPLSASFTVYPNPANNVINMQLNANATSTIKVQLLDIAGRYITTQTFAQNAKITLPSVSLPNGVYVIKVIANGERMTQKVIVQH